MKRDRQAVIKQMISREKIGTQEEIKQRLEAEGITVTQATLSRDLREIGLLKLRDVLANLIDSDENPEILGTVAGADTLLVICKDAMVAEKLESEFH